VSATAFAAVAVAGLQVHPASARARISDTVNRQLIVRFSSAAASAHACPDDHRPRRRRRHTPGRLPATVDPVPALQGRTATGGRPDLHRVIGDAP
jgi:hypothetical protein